MYEKMKPREFNSLLEQCFRLPGYQDPACPQLPVRLPGHFAYQLLNSHLETGGVRQPDGTVDTYTVLRQLMVIYRAGGKPARYVYLELHSRGPAADKLKDFGRKAGAADAFFGREIERYQARLN